MKLRTMKKGIALVIMLVMLLTAVSALAASDSQRLNRFYELAVQYIKSEMYDKAMTALDGALQYCDEEADKDFYADIHLKKGCVYVLQKDYENGQAELDEALRVDPELSDAYLVKTQIFSETGDFASAAATMEKYIELSNTPENYETLSSLYSQAGDSEKAAEAYQKFLEAANVEGAQSTYSMAVFKMDSGDYDGAIADFATIYEDADYGIAANYYTGVCYLQKAEYENALAAFEKCTDHAADFNGLQYNIGICSMQLGKLEEAIAAFTASIETETYKADALYNRAICSFTTTANEEMADEQKVTVLNSAVEDLTAYLAAVTEDAKANAEEGAEIPEVVDSANYYRGACYVSLGEYAKAIEDYTACIENDVLADDCLWNRALIYLQNGQIEEAKADLNACIEKELHPDEAMYYRALASDAQEDYQAAIDDLTVLIGREYNLGDMYYQRAQEYQKLGDDEHYLEDLEASLNY